MAEVVMPDGDRRNGRAGMPARQPPVAPERWLHSETIEDLRARRARQGLPTPQTTLLPEQPYPWQARPARAGKGGGVAAGRYVLTSMLAILLGLLVGVIAAVIVFAASAPALGR